MFGKFKTTILFSLLAAACAAPEDPSIEYYTVLSSRSAEYEMYNEGTTSKLPTYWGTHKSHAAAESAAQNQYDSWTNRMWRPADWEDTGPTYVTVINEIVVDKVKPEDQAKIDQLESQLASVNSQIADIDSCEVTTPRIDSLERRWDNSYKWFVDYKTVPAGTTMDLWERGFDQTCGPNLKRTRTCIDGSWSDITTQSEFVSDSCNLISDHMPTGRTASRTADRSECPTIANFNELNTHNYPREFASCTNVCFNRTGYFGSLLPENHPQFYSDVSPALREDCFECEMSKYSNTCFYPRDEFYVFKYRQQIDPKETFELPF